MVVVDEVSSKVIVVVDVSSVVEGAAAIENVQNSVSIIGID